MTVEEIENIIDTEYRNLINKINENLISIFIIGSMKDKHTELKKYNDYDLRIVVKDMNKYTYEVIKNFNEKIKKILQNYNLNVDYSFIIGPVRHITKSETNLLIHCLPMTEDTLEGLPLTHRYSYSCNYRIIYGMDIIKKYNNIRFTGKDVIECTEGIDYCIQIIKSNTIQYGIWKEKNDNIQVFNEKREMNDYMLFEVLRYSILKSLDNTMKIISWKNKFVPKDIKKRLEIVYVEINDEMMNKIDMLLNGTFEQYIKNKEEIKKYTLIILEKIRKYILTNSL